MDLLFVIYLIQSCGRLGVVVTFLSPTTLAPPTQIIRKPVHFGIVLLIWGEWRRPKTVIISLPLIDYLSARPVNIPKAFELDGCNLYPTTLSYAIFASPSVSFLFCFDFFPHQISPIRRYTSFDFIFLKKSKKICFFLPPPLDLQGKKLKL